MRSRHHHPGLSGTVIKVVIFAVLSILLTSIVISTLLDVNTQAATGYVAQFTNASELQAGDTVRIAGVEVGKISAVTLQQNHADVSFSVDNSQHLTTTTLAAIHFENLLGQRFLAILPGNPGGKPLPPGGVIPLSHTEPAINLTAVFDGFSLCSPPSRPTRSISWPGPSSTSSRTSREPSRTSWPRRRP